MNPNAKIITVAQQKGGAGKTTVAAHIAVALSQRGKRVALIDVDPQGSISFWYKIRENIFGEGYTGLYFKALSGWKIDNEIINLRKNFDYILIDSPPHSEADAKSVMRIADLVVIPVQPSPTDLWAIKKTLEIVEKENITHQIVLNRVTPNSKLAEEAIKELKKKDLPSLGNRIVFATALKDGKTVTETQPKSVAAEEVKKLTDKILKTFVAQKNKAA